MRVVAAAVRVRIRAAAPRPIAERAACVARGASASWTGQWKRQHFHKVLNDDGSANGGARPDAVPIAACVSVRTAVCAIRATDRIRERATSIRAVIKGTARVARRARAWRTSIYYIVGNRRLNGNFKRRLKLYGFLRSDHARHGSAFEAPTRTNVAFVTVRTAVLLVGAAVGVRVRAAAKGAVLKRAAGIALRARAWRTRGLLLHRLALYHHRHFLGMLCIGNANETRALITLASGKIARISTGTAMILVRATVRIHKRAAAIREIIQHTARVAWRASAIGAG